MLARITNQTSPQSPTPLDENNEIKRELEFSGLNSSITQKQDPNTKSSKAVFQSGYSLWNSLEKILTGSSLKSVSKKLQFSPSFYGSPNARVEQSPTAQIKKSLGETESR